ncbi:uncharacterized protein LOC133907853 [Phragmites australis]|uniref:uncharacterized protein LOC133907853 n=1 Tax=Phragmites australis TaxID=29695 RepID=UPI002D785E64|nr:uncharacterized protein LOC133907853 [Phragmites australis]
MPQNQEANTSQRIKVSRMHLTLSPVRTTRKAAAHARSASQPCHHSHPALARLDGGVRELRSWSASASSSGMSSGSGLALVEAVLVALEELLAAPRAAVALHDADDQVLEGFLALADAYSTFGSALLAAKQSVAEARAGVRRGDGAMLAASVCAHRRTEKELCHLAATMRHATVASSRPAGVTTDTEVVDVVAEAAVAIAEASAVVFLGCAAMSPGVSAVVHTLSSRKWLARLGVVLADRKVVPQTAVAALEELEECIGAVESGSEKVFRKLLQARVLLLNIHNPL